MAFGDSGSVPDPLVGSRNQFFQIRVCQNARRRETSKRGNLRSLQVHEMDNGHTAKRRSSLDTLTDAGMQGELIPGFAADAPSALFFETIEEIYARVFRELKPRTPVPQITVRYCRFVNANSSVRLDGDRIEVKISDILESAPSPVAESLAQILLGKLFRKPASRAHAHRYRLYLNRKDMRGQMQLVRQIRGRKYLSGPQGSQFDLAGIFEKHNADFFNGILGQPQLGWSLRRSRTMLGHFDPSHNAIVISRIFDEPGIPRVAVEYVMFHEMLHLQFPVCHRGARRCVHTREFREAEKRFPLLKEAREALKRLR